MEAFIKQNEEKDLLRLSTAGSVDDGKSTLIGRLLYDSNGVYEDQIASVRKAGESFRRRVRPGAADRRPARRTRTGHHHRRRLPLFFDAEAQIHHRRHARPRAVHAQHGDRRFHRQSRHHSGRRAQRRAAAIAPPRIHRLHAGHSAPRGGGEQDGSGRVQRSRLRADSRRLRRLRLAPASARSALHSDQRAQRRQRCREEREHAVVRRLEPAALPRNRARGERPQHDRTAFSGAVCSPARSGFSRICGHRWPRA